MAKKPSQNATPAKNAGRTRRSKAVKKPVTIEHDAKDAKKADASKPDTSRRSVPSSKLAIDAAKAPSANPAAKTAPKQSEAKKDMPDTTAKSAAMKTKGTKTSTGSADTKPSSPGSTKPILASANSPTSSTTSSAGKKSGGWGPTLLAACIGGIVALGLAGLLQYAGILSTPGASTVDAEATTRLESRIAGLEEELRSQPEIGVTGEEVAKLIDNRLAAASSPATERVTQLENGLAQLRDQLASVPNETTVGSAIAAQVAELSEEVANLKSGGQVSTNASSGANVASDARIEEIGKSVSNFRTELSAQIGTIKESVVSAKTEQASIKTQMAVTNAKLDNINATAQQTMTDIAALRDRVENGADKRAAAAIAAAALKNDIDSGIAFAASLSNLRAFSSGMTELESLDSFAEKGVPTVTQLSAEFDGSVSDAILAATAPVEDGSLASRLAAGARSLVEVKPIGMVEGETPQARVSQITEALKNGNLSKASETWGTLPDAGREASMDWHSRLQARLTANSVVNGTVESILNSSRGG